MEDGTEFLVTEFKLYGRYCLLLYEGQTTVMYQEIVLSRLILNSQHKVYSAKWKYKTV